MLRVFITLLLLFTVTISFASNEKAKDLEKLYAVEKADFPVYSGDYMSAEDVDLTFLTQDKYLISEGSKLFYADNTGNKKIISDNLVSGYYKLFTPFYIASQKKIVYFERTNNTFGGLSMYIQSVDSGKGDTLSEKKLLLNNISANIFNYSYVDSKKLLIFQINEKLYVYDFNELPKVIFKGISSYISVPEEEKVYVIVKDKTDIENGNGNGKNRKMGTVYVSDYFGNNQVKLAESVVYCEYYKKLGMFLLATKKDFYRCNLYISDKTEGYAPKLILKNVIFKDFLKTHIETPLHPFSVRSVPSFRMVPEEAKVFAITVSEDTEDKIQNSKRDLVLIDLKNGNSKNIVSDILDFDYNVVTKNIVYYQKVSDKYTNIYKMNYPTLKTQMIAEKAYLVPETHGYYKDPQENRAADYVFYVSEAGDSLTLHLMDINSDKEIFKKDNVVFKDVSENIFYPSIDVLAVKYYKTENNSENSYYTLINPATATEIEFRCNYIKPHYSVERIATLENRKYSEFEERPYLIVYELTSSPTKPEGFAVSADGKIFYKLKGDELRKLSTGSEISKLIDKEDAIKKNIDDLNKKAEGKIEELNNLYAKKKAEYESELKKLNQLYKDKEEKLKANIEKAIAQKQSELDGLNEKYQRKEDELKKNYDTAKAQIEKQMSDLTESVKAQKEKLLEEQKNTQVALGNLKGDIKKAEEDKKAAEAGLERLKQKQADLEKQLTLAQERIDQQKKDLDAKSLRIQKDMQDLTVARQKIQSEVNDAKKELASTVSEKNKALAEKQKLDAEVPKLQEKINELRKQADLDTINKEKDDLTKAVTDLTNKKQNLDNDLTKLNNDKENLSKQIEPIQKTLADLQEKQKQLSLDLSTSQKDKATADKEKQKLEADRDALNKEIEKLIAEKAKLIDEIKIDEENTKKSLEALRKGLMEYSKKNWNAAIAYFDEALKFKPDNFLAQLYKMDVILKNLITQTEEKDKRTQKILNDKNKKQPPKKK